MKHEVMTLQTKKMLSASLKKFMEKKSLSKVTVSEIIEDCGVNRKTFYYNFIDIYAMQKWTHEKVEENQHIINCAYDAMGRDEMKRFFYADFIEVIRKAIEAGVRELSISVDEDFKQYLADFFAEALASVLIGWVKNPERNSREKVLEYTTLICRTSIPSALKAKAN